MKKTLKIMGMSLALAAIVAAGTITATNIGFVDNVFSQNHIRRLNASTASEMEYVEGKDMYFSESFFHHSPTVYDESLATASLFMARASGAGSSNKTEEWHLNQSKNLGQFFADVKFTDFEVNEDYRSEARFDTIGVGCAKREIEIDSKTYTVIGICPRSGGYYLEWANNVFLGDGSKSDYMHEGWFNAANKVNNFLKDYIVSKEIKGNVKLWMTGFSRGGATINIASALLDNKIANRENFFGEDVNISTEDIYCYTFEAPQGGNVNSRTVKAPKDKLYNNIWNIVNPNDLVPKVAMGQYGFTRFGTDRFVTTKLYDPANFESNREVMKKFYKQSGWKPEEITADNFNLECIPSSKIGEFASAIWNSLTNRDMSYIENFSAFAKDPTKVNYDANITSTLLIEEMVKHIGSRENYADKIQPAAVELMKALTGENGTQVGDLISVGIPALVGLTVGGVVYSITKSSSIAETVTNYLGKLLPEGSVKIGFRAVMPLIEVIANTYSEKPHEVMSFIKYREEIFANHDNDILLAHMKAADDLYINTYNAKHADKVYKVELRDNADLARIQFFGFNDIGLRLNGKRLVNVEGFRGDKSIVWECASNCAVGYYSYLTEEKMELFMPVKKTYNLHTTSYSLKPRHFISYSASYQCASPLDRGTFKKQVDHYEDNVWFSSDMVDRNINFNI